MTPQQAAAEVTRQERAHTLEQCYNSGRDHAAYGWSRSPWGHWNTEQLEAYDRGYEFQLKIEKDERENT